MTEDRSIVDALVMLSKAIEGQTESNQLIAERFAATNPRGGGTRRTANEALGLAVYALIEDPTRSQRDISRDCGCSQSTLSRDPVFMRVFKSFSVRPDGLHSGHMDADGTVVAVQE